MYFIFFVTNLSLTLSCLPSTEIGKPLDANTNGATENNDLSSGALDLQGGEVPIDSAKLAEHPNPSEVAPVDPSNEKRKLEDGEELENKRARVE